MYNGSISFVSQYSVTVRLSQTSQYPVLSVIFVDIGIFQYTDARTIFNYASLSRQDLYFPSSLRWTSLENKGMENLIQNIFQLTQFLSHSYRNIDRVNSCGTDYGPQRA